MKVLNKIVIYTVVLTTTFSPLITKAANQSAQSIDVCFVNLDYAGNIMSSLPQGSSININLFTDPGHLVEGKINSYGTTSIPISQSSVSQPNTDLSGNDGILDSYCTKQSFTNDTNHEYTYTQATITSNLDWMTVRYNDEISINYVHPDIAFPYSGEWFDNIAGNEAARNTNADGHITMTSERSDRTLVIVSQLDVNLPTYAVKFDDSITAANEYTLSSIPQNIQPDSTMNLRFTVQNTGTLKWLSSLDGTAGNPVNVSYHWKNLDDDSQSKYDGNRAVINHDLDYTQNDSNITLTINAPNAPGNYQLILDLVHEGVTWFSAKGADTKTFNITVGTPVVKPVVQPQAQPITTIRSTSPQALTATLSNTTNYTVQPYSGNPNWHCGGYDCLTGIAEDFYHCSANGIPNDAPNTTDTSILSTKCWWPIYIQNKWIWDTYGVPYPYSMSQPWNYLQVGWILEIPTNGGVVVIPPPPTNPPTGNFSGGVNGSSPLDPYAGMNGFNYIWPQVTFDRWIAWDGSYKTDAIKWSETKRPDAPTITGISTSSTGTTATIYGVALPKNQPMGVSVWNEFRYCWACGSAWEYSYQQGYAQNVKVVLFKNNWQYIGEVWNDRSDGRWSITLPIGTSINPGDNVFAEVQIEADFNFYGLHWWSNTTENVNFDLRNPKYTGYPYFGSGGGNGVRVPNIYIDTRSNEEKWIDYRAMLLGATGASSIINICGVPAKTYNNLKNGPGAILFVKGKPIYSYGGTWDTFNYYGDKCTRFGVPTEDPVEPAGVGPFNTPGAYQQFQNGRMYWSWKYLGKFTYGVISNKYEQAWGTNSNYGWPTSETYATTENGTSTVCQNFEGGRICENEIQPKTESQKAFESKLGRSVSTNEIMKTCGFDSVAINSGVALYNGNTKQTRLVTGAIYNSWLSNCNAYGFPENDTSSVNSGVSSVTGQAQRFNLNKPFVYDFYNSGFGLFMLEGTARNLYESANGLGGTGFPTANAYTDSLRGVCLQTEKQLLCENSYPEWYTPLKAKFQELNKPFDYTNRFNLCGNNIYTAINLPNSEGVVYYDSNYKNVRVINGAIYTEWVKGSCNQYGLPENDTTNVTSYVPTSGTDQRFHRDTQTFDFYFYANPPGVIVLEGTARNLYESAHSLGSTGFPKKVYTDTNRGICVDTEKETLCEKEVPTGQICKVGEVIDNGICVEKKVAECHAKGMEKYVNPNDANDVTCAKINNAPYINQWLDSNGNTNNPTAGRVMCGANAVTMALGMKGIITETDFDKLKSYTYNDNGVNINGFNRQCDMVFDFFGGLHMYGITGSFSYTGAAGDCSFSDWGNITKYLKGINLGSGNYGDPIAKFTDYLNTILIPTINNGGGVVQGVGANIQGNDIAHIILVIGYTDDGRLVVNDSYTNLMGNSVDYSNNGRGAIYEVGVNNFYLGNYVKF